MSGILGSTVLVSCGIEASCGDGDGVAKSMSPAVLCLEGSWLAEWGDLVRALCAGLAHGWVGMLCVCGLLVVRHHSSRHALVGRVDGMLVFGRLRIGQLREVHLLWFVSLGL